MRHIHGAHENKSFECEDCGFKTPRKDTLKRHKTAKHENASDNSHLPGADGNGFSDFRNVQTQTNPIVNAPMDFYQPSGYSHIQTQTNPLQVVNAPLTGNFQHPPTYKHVQTQTVGDHPATYRDLGTQTYTQQRELDTYSEASDVSSDDVNFKRDGNYRNAKKLINKAIKLMNTLVKTNVEWKHLIALMLQESYLKKK